jgi:hypothetical protein
MQRAGRVRQRRRACCGDAVQARKEGTSGRSGAVRWWAQVERCQTSGVDVEGETARSCSPGPLQWKPTRTRARTREGLELGQIGSLAAETRPSALTTKRNLPGLRHKRDGGSMAIWHAQPSAVTAAWRSLRAAHGLSLERASVPSAVERSPLAQTVETAGGPPTLGISFDRPAIGRCSTHLRSQQSRLRWVLTHPCTEKGSGGRRQSPCAGETVPSKVEIGGRRA